VPDQEEINALLNSLSNACSKVNKRAQATYAVSFDSVRDLSNDLCEIARVESALVAKCPTVSPKYKADKDGLIVDTSLPQISWETLYSDPDKSFEPRSVATLAVASYIWLSRYSTDISASGLADVLKPLLESYLLESEKIKQVVAQILVLWLGELKTKIQQTNNYKKRIDGLMRSWYLFSLSRHFDNPVMSLKKELRGLDIFQLWVCSLPKGLVNWVDTIQLDLQSGLTLFEILALATGATAILAGLSAAVLAGLSLSHTLNGLVIPIAASGLLVLLAGVACIVFARYSCARDSKRLVTQDFADRLKSCPDTIFQKASKQPLDDNAVSCLFALQSTQGP